MRALGFFCNTTYSKETKKSDQRFFLKNTQPMLLNGKKRNLRQKEKKLSLALKCWGPLRWQGLGRQYAHLWATAHVVSRSEALGTPHTVGAM